MSKAFSVNLRRIGLLVSFFLLTSGANGISSTDFGTIQISGAGIKGPLAFANVQIFALDPSYPDYYDKTSPISTTITNEYAEIQGLSFPRQIKPPYILTIEGGNAIDLNTGVAPVIDTLITVITNDMLASNRPIFATPLTTLVFHMARLETETKSYKNNRAKNKAFSENVSNTASTVSSTFAVGQDTTIDLFRAPLVINEFTTELADQELAVYHRAAVEAFASKVDALSLLGDTDADVIIQKLALDIYRDGIIDNADNGVPVGDIDPLVLSQDPMELQIPNTIYRIKDLMMLMAEERVLIGTHMGPTFLMESIAFPDETILTDPVDSTEPVVTLSVDEINFGDQEIGVTSNPIGLVLTNSGVAPLVISGISISTGFIEANNCNNEVPAGGSCVIDIQFVPTSPGNTSGVLTINSNDTVGMHNINLAGSAYNPAPEGTLISSGPIVINGQQDVVISGLQITNPNGHCIQVTGGSSNITIENSEIGPCSKKGIDIVSSSDVVVQHNYIHNIQNEAVMSYESHDITVDSNVIENVESGYEMWTTTIGNLSFTNNWVKNVSRRAGSDNGGNVAMCAFVTGGSTRINNNIGINILGESNPEDLVNIFKSGGTPDDPIQVKNNKFYGGGPAASGGGIMLGDQGGSYQIAENNILVSPGGYGIAIAGGHHNTLSNNKVYSPADDQRPFANIGMTVWRFNHNGDGTKPGDCHSHTVELNEITFWQGPNYKNQGKSAFLNPQWNPDYGADGLEPNCGAVAGWNTNMLDTESSQPANLDMSIWNPAWDTP